jgi:hypothetical protein
MELQPAVSVFPFLTPDEFHQACKAFVTRVYAVGGPEEVGWLSMTCLSIVVSMETILSYFLRFCLYSSKTSPHQLLRLRMSEHQGP